MLKNFHKIELNSLTSRMLNFWEKDFEKSIQKHKEFLMKYRSKKWLEAKEHIDKYRFSKPEFTLYYTLFLERIDELSKQTLPDDWSGVFIAKTK